MCRKQCVKGAGLATLGLALASLGGCQTYLPATGQTLPSPEYLDHPPQFIAPSPVFPLSRELATMEAQEGAPVPGAGLLVPPPPGVR